MDEALASAAAGEIWRAWRSHQLIDGLPDACRPLSVEDGYQAQRALVALSGSLPVGWKIAATSAAGQAHIGVDGPIAGRLLGGYLYPGGAALPAADLHMAVMEAEFAFNLWEDLAPREADYTVDEVMAAVETLYLAIEVPDSRYRDFTVVGAPQLIADNACTAFFVQGAEAEDWRGIDLAAHPVSVTLNGERVAQGSGANVLGDPRIALTWLANDCVQRGEPLRAGEIITTGTCVTPVSIKPGDYATADFGPLGRVHVRFVE